MRQRGKASGLQKSVQRFGAEVPKVLKQQHVPSAASNLRHCAANIRHCYVEMSARPNNASNQIDVPIKVGQMPKDVERSHERLAFPWNGGAGKVGPTAAVNSGTVRACSPSPTPNFKASAVGIASDA